MGGWGSELKERAMAVQVYQVEGSVLELAAAAQAQERALAVQVRRLAWRMGELVAVPEQVSRLEQEAGGRIGSTCAACGGEHVGDGDQA